MLPKNTLLRDTPFVLNKGKQFRFIFAQKLRLKLKVD